MKDRSARSDFIQCGFGRERRERNRGRVGWVGGWVPVAAAACGGYK
jgi:hypothetical protein